MRIFSAMEDIQTSAALWEGRKGGREGKKEGEKKKKTPARNF